MARKRHVVMPIATIALISLLDAPWILRWQFGPNVDFTTYFGLALSVMLVCALILVVLVTFFKRLRGKIQTNSKFRSISILQRKTRQMPAVKQTIAPQPTQSVTETNLFKRAQSLAKPAIALVRTYPPDKNVKTRSHFGGWPDLPKGVPWPRTVSNTPRATQPNPNTPLHFMAQIDLGELPWRPPAMPASGTLLFFARVDEEMVWNYGNSRDDVCVIYDPNSTGVETLPPADLIKLQGGYNDFERYFILEGEGPLQGYSAWPLVAVQISTLPHWGAFERQPKEFNFKEHQREEKQFALSQFEGVWQTRLPFQEKSDTGYVIEEKIITPEGNFFAEKLTDRCLEEFLSIPRGAALLARRLHSDLKRNPSRKTAAKIAKLWISRLEAEPRGYRLNPRILKQFAQLVEKKYQPPHRVAQLGRLKTCVEAALKQLINESAYGQICEQKITSDAFYAMQNDHVVARAIRFPESGDPIDKVSIHYHQMFGHIVTSQGATAPLESTKICLLQLVSDYGLNLMICDVGEMEFWIKLEDLEARRFDNVWGTTQGG